ncbi:hypothetical protein [Mobiluncus mulieris]|uniref:hypothetical protein n=1 Tax=Mobiluncus mulieris TaxID=2052 RepID=UPI00242EF9E0|nr:hypothetical protein [Mobiluncus mulieris]
MGIEKSLEDTPGDDSIARVTGCDPQTATPQWDGGDEAMKDMGGYADCCGASEADEPCPYRPPTAEEVARFSRKQEERA